MVARPWNIKMCVLNDLMFLLEKEREEKRKTIIAKSIREDCPLLQLSGWRLS